MADGLLQQLQRFDLAGRVERTVSWFRGLEGRASRLVGAGLGVVSAFAFAPFYAWPLLFFTLPALVWMIDGTACARRPWAAAAWIGWAFGFGYFLIGLHWVAYAFVVDADRHAWLLPFVAVLFPGGLALFFALAAGVARLRWSNGWARIVLFAAAIAAVEWLRGHILTGLPWNLPGYVWSGSDAMFQSVAVWGIYGLSLLTLLAFLAPAALFDAQGRRVLGPWPLVAPAVLLALLFAVGSVRLPSAPVPVRKDVALRIVQPDVPQAEKWKAEFFERNWRRLVDLTRMEGLDSRTVVVWPEAAPPFLLLSQPGGLDAVGAILPERATLLTGTVRAEGEGEARVGFNSMAAVSGSGKVLAVYDKAHLVPFGEYLPLFWLLEPLGITKLTGGSGGFKEGPGVRTLTIASLPSFGPLICYEVIFPGEVVESGRRPDWLVTMTDDSWFGPWTGPYQHLGIAKIRAAEEGLPIIRAANTGVSAVIDPYGRVIASLGLNETGVLDAELPTQLVPTIYSIAGDAIFLIMLLLATGVSTVFFRSTP
ncbi:MAG: apolipoprotein N-acyltransferase [Alphaproteobacteria bacterium]|nr:apolipoprotein N-acyltransferase [Alphaproteobacteria bacterium]